jgi:predicted transcriptional regulator
MTEISPEKRLARKRRGEDFLARLKSSGLTPTQFRERTGITRNVFYNLSIGQEPKPDQKRRIEMAFADTTAAPQ